MPEHSPYDVVIVGAGIAGAILAKTLTRAGRRVLLLEAGLGEGLSLEGEAARRNYASYLERFYTASAKVPNSPYPNLSDAPSPDVLDLAPIQPGKPDARGYFVQQGPVPFASDYARTPGGTTLHWLGTCLRMLPNDFRMKSTYGQGVDWPISHEDLRPYYEMAEREIGVAGDVEEQAYPQTGKGFFGRGYQFPMHKIPQSHLDHLMAEGLQGQAVQADGREVALRVISTPQGRNAMPNAHYRLGEPVWDGQALRAGRGASGFQPAGAVWDDDVGQRCEGNASCTPICPVQAKYNALKTLKRARPELLEIVPQAVASKIELAADGTVTGITYKRYRDPASPEHTVHTVRGRYYVLAAHAVENAKLLLASGAAKSSDQVGRNLMDHMVLLTWGLTPQRGYPFRGPGSTSNIPVFRDGGFRAEHAAFIVPIDNWGWGWPRFSPGSDLDQAVNQFNMIGEGLRRHLNDRLTRQLLLHFECEQLPEPGNRITISPQYLDALGNPRPVISYDVSPYTRAAFKSARHISDQIFAACGIEDHTQYLPTEADYLEHQGVGYTFRGAGHLVGTHRMGFTARDSVVDRTLRTWDHDNLYLVGSGSMPTIGTSNPTLTLAALSFVAAERLLQRLDEPLVVAAAAAPPAAAAAPTATRPGSSAPVPPSKPAGPSSPSRPFMPYVLAGRHCLVPQAAPGPLPFKQVKSLAALQSNLQTAIMLEHSTIPPYLCALYSMHEDANAEAAQIIRSVVVEEMLHMMLAANVLNAIGGEPDLVHRRFLPDYPTPLPHGDASFEVGLHRFAHETMVTFKRIELPTPERRKPRASGYHTIGQFYEAVEDGLKTLARQGRLFSGDRARQITPEHYYGAGGRIVSVHNLETALEALHEIVGQGEGIDHSIVDTDHAIFGEEVQIAHYFRFDEIVQRKRYASGDTPKSGPHGAPLPVDYTRVHPMRANPKLACCPEGSELWRKTHAFNELYMALLHDMHDALNGAPARLEQAVVRMYALKYQAVELMKIPVGNKGETAGPSFEYTPPRGRS